MNRLFSTTVGLLALACCCGCDSTEAPTAAYPNRAIKIVVPFTAGGGGDTFARLIKKAIEDEGLLEQPLVIVNVGGAGGTIGSRRVKNMRPDGYTVLLLHDAIMMAKYSGKVPYGPESFEAVAGTAENALVLAVLEDSEYTNLNKLMSAAEEQPSTVTFGCNLATPTHYVGLLLERERPKAVFRFVQSGDGAERFSALKGEHIAATVFSTEEFVRYQPEGIRALAVFSQERHPALPDTPTAIEQGIEAEADITQFWWMPKGAPPARVDFFANVLKRAMQSDYVRERLAEVHTKPSFYAGQDLTERLDRLEKNVAAVDLQRPVRMPNLPAILFGGIVVLGIVAGVRSWTTPSPAVEKKVAPRTMFVLVSIGLTLLYGLALSIDVNGVAIGFRWATLVFVAVLGLCIAWQNKQLNMRSGALILALALALSLGLHWVFTHLFTTDLP